MLLLSGKQQRNLRPIPTVHRKPFTCKRERLLYLECEKELAADFRGYTRIRQLNSLEVDFLLIREFPRKSAANKPAVRLTAIRRGEKLTSLPREETLSLSSADPPVFYDPAGRRWK